MRLIVLLVAVGSVATLPSLHDSSIYKKRPVRNIRYEALHDDENDPNLELLFANSLWRHGDRAATAAVPGGLDQFTEDDWTFGGGGYGELSPEGMKEHFDLGRMIRKRYVDTYKLLSSAYNAKEIYIRASDKNRTLISAYANVAGMYSGFGIAGQNFPTKEQVPDWPVGYIPIPVHTVDYGTDHILHPDAPCPRQDQLYEIMRASPEYQSYVNDPQVSQVLKYLSDKTQTDVNFDNIYDTQDPIFCEANHIDELNQTAGSNIQDFYPWFYEGDLPSWVDWIQDRSDAFMNGIGNPNGVNGIDMSVEIPKIRAGDTLKLVASNVNGVLACRDGPDSSECGKFYKKLRYYALSAHDSTVSAFLTILGVQKYMVPEGGMEYSSTVLFEVYEDKTTAERFFKVLYHANKNSEFKSVTSFVEGCDPMKSVCPLAVLDDIVKKYAPETDVATLCNIPVEISSPTTTTTVQSAANPTVATESPPLPKTSTQQPTTTSGVFSPSLLSALAATILCLL